MKIAIPVVSDALCVHFGHCETFALLDVDAQKQQIVQKEDVTPPPHEPGLLPRWLAERGVNLVIAGGMGQRAQGLFNQQNIQVLVGAPSWSPESLVQAYMQGTLPTGVNGCDH